MSDILERLRLNADATEGCGALYDEAADEIERLNRGIKTIWQMCHTCSYVDTIEDELERLMNGHEPVKRTEPKGYVSKAEKRLIQERDEAHEAARMLLKHVQCDDIHHKPDQYHDYDEPCKALAAMVEKYPFLKPTEPDRPYTSRPNVKFYDFGLPHEKGPNNESDQTP